MAGDWIKIRSNIKDDPDVIVIAGLLALDEYSVVGRLHAVWAWLDQHSKDGANVRITSASLDRLAGCPGFADAMREVGWLEGADGSFTFPDFDRHNGQSAKRRASDAKRKQESRAQDAKADKCPHNNGTNVLEKPDQSTGEKSINTVLSPSTHPTEDEVVCYGKTAGVPEQSCRKFFNHFASVGWKDKNHNSIVDWKAKLKSWQSNENAGLAERKHFGSNGNSKHNKPEKIYDPTKPHSVSNVL